MQRRAFFRLTFLTPLAGLLSSLPTLLGESGRTVEAKKSPGKRHVPCVGFVDEHEYWENHELYCTGASCCCEGPVYNC